jgi:hypothetical protein
MPDKPVSTTQYWRNRAQIARTNADKTKDPGTKRMLLGIAKAYEHLAERTQRQLRRAKKSK